MANKPKEDATQAEPKAEFDSSKLNIYQKAQLGKTFKFTLIDGGCEPEFAERMTLWLLLQVK